MSRAIIRQVTPEELAASPYTVRPMRRDMRPAIWLLSAIATIGAVWLAASYGVQWLLSGLGSGTIF